MISDHNMGYGVSNALRFSLLELVLGTFFKGTGDGSVGGFWWSLHFNWIPVPQRIRNAQKSRIDPYPCVVLAAFASEGRTVESNSIVFFFSCRSPTMAGGLLAAHREYFFEIGGYGRCPEDKFEANSEHLSLSNLDDDMEVRSACDSMQKRRW